jgi:hypothetical protein
MKIKALYQITFCITEGLKYFISCFRLFLCTGRSQSYGAVVRVVFGKSLAYERIGVIWRAERTRWDKCRHSFYIHECVFLPRYIISSAFSPLLTWSSMYCILFHVYLSLWLPSSMYCTLFYVYFISVASYLIKRWDEWCTYNLVTV